MQIHQIARSATALQQPVDEDALREQLEQQLQGETVCDVTEIATGHFNNTYRVCTEQAAYILKVAPAPNANVFYWERRLMQRERSVATTLRAASPLVPEYLSFFAVAGRDAFLQPCAEGTVWHEVSDSLSAAENDRLWKQLGPFARQLHSVEGDSFGFPSPTQRFGRWSQFIADNVAGMAEDCRRLDVLTSEVEAYLQHLPQFHAELDRVTTPRLLHGDLWPRNVIIGGTGDDIHIEAVIDGERAFWGDPLSDWVLILYGVPEGFWQGYGTNLLAATDPVRIVIYKGMYFMLNILEASRSGEASDQPRALLAEVNRQLAGFRARC